MRQSDGAILRRLDFDAYGRKLATSSGTMDIVPFGFAGGLWDPDTGLVRFGARDYDPESGRWLSKDPSRFGGGTNFYEYAGGDPVNSVDPTGHVAFPVLVLAGAAFLQVFLADNEEAAHRAALGEIAALGVNTAASLAVRAALTRLAARSAAPLVCEGSVGAMAFNTGRWGKGSYSSAVNSLFDHFERHGAEVGAESAEHYLVKAQDFSTRLRGARSFPVEGATQGVTRYVKGGRYIDLGPDGEIISFGAR